MEHFSPSRSRGDDIAARINDRLRTSLLHLAEQSSLALDRDFLGEIGARITQPTEPGFLSPALYGLHATALRAAEEQDFPQLRHALDLAASRAWILPRREVFPLDALPAPFLGIYKDALAADVTTPISIAAPSPDDTVRSQRRVDQALDLLSRAAPELAGEVESVLAQIILVSGRDAKAFSTFAGGSSFDLWGAVFLNVDAFTDAIELAVGIVHEVAHLTLFAEAIDEPLVLNDPDETFPSPLRAEPRPMDGIFHATYVVARMHLAASCLLDHGGLDEAIQDRLRRDLEQDTRLFRDGWDTIAAHGRLTSLGRDIIEAARSYMAGAGHRTDVRPLKP